MFKRNVQSIRELIMKNLRAQGLETPLLHRRLVGLWPEIMGDMIAGYTQDIYISNQTLVVHLTNPALRSDLSMMKKDIVKRMNDAVGSQVIAEVRFC